MKIFIDKIEIFGYHGCLEEEKKTGQYFLVSLELALGSAVSGQADDLERTVDYSLVCGQVESIVTSSRFNLLESLTDKIAQTLLLSYPELDSVKVAVEKPSAPVPVRFESLGVTVERGWHTVFLSLGSNLNDREKNIRGAVERICASSGFKAGMCSQIIETEPWGVENQPKFLNCALEVKTWLEPEELVSSLKQIERDLGRVPGTKWGSRIIDIDILLYDLIIYKSERLQIPHPYMHERDFVLVPLAEIAPNAIHPVKKKYIREFL
ncbi:MAG: 2-amino-4-hydroxy-6-hydroxymethyldihydropteridine diphosphokinase [Clostridiales bacterium]|nr:2-amino-4-hydroxy-6-hydroxymethyldihydropteridine diphosphokinase [Clostridiales bacterium]